MREFWIGIQESNEKPFAMLINFKVSGTDP